MDGLRMALIGLVLVLGVTSALQYADGRVADALIEEASADAETARELAVEAAQEYASYRRAAMIEIDALERRREELEAGQRELESEINRLSLEAVAAGDSLAATLDSVAVILPELGTQAQRQHAQERRAFRQAMETVREERTQWRSIAESADSARDVALRQAEMADELVGYLTARAETAERERDLLREQLNPGFLDRLTRDLPQKAGVVGVVILATVIATR